MLCELLVTATRGLVGAGLAATVALLFWRYGGQFVGDYRRLRVEACTLLTTHAPLFTNLSLDPTDEEGAARKAASGELRRVADRLTNAECPPSWLTWILGLPAEAEIAEAGRAIRSLSNNLFLPHMPTPDDKHAHEPLNRDACQEARRLLRCRPQRPWESN